ncbi:MAG TPA: hypothetical protein VER11_19365 [Polyangiaceae bacterium]|nr:hypothetical protein [Polyangiaceae bacterium]
MRQSAKRRRAIYPWLAGSWAVLALLSSGCVDDPKRARASGGAAGTAGVGHVAGGGGVGGESGSDIMGEAGASGASIEPEGGKGGTSGASGGPGAGGEAGSREDAAGAGGDTASAQAGSAGAAGEVDTFNEPCPGSSLDGWASVAGFDFDPPVNTPVWQEVSVSNAADLQTYAAAAEPYFIHVSGTIALPVLDVKSNKMIEGVDRDATIEGGIRIAGTSTATADMVSNVVIRNLHINASTSQTATMPVDIDGISVTYAHHVWIDHVDVWDAPGDNIDITHGSDYITVSWSKVRFVTDTNRRGVRVGDSDTNEAEDSGRLKVTFHHNFWTASVNQRMPRVRFGDVHVYDNYYAGSSDTPNAYCVAAAINSRLLVENNYFDGVQLPHVFFSFVNSAAVYAEPTAQMVANGNTYVGASDEESGKLSGQGSAFTPPYSVVLEPADTRLKGFLRHCTGPVNPVPATPN